MGDGADRVIASGGEPAPIQPLIQALDTTRATSDGQGTAVVRSARAASSNWPFSDDFTPAAAFWILVLLCGWVAIYVLPLEQRPLIMPDETRYAEIPREMLNTGDWIAPRLAGLRYFEKPPLGYWVNAIALSLLGERALAVRLPSTMAAGLTALLVFWFVRATSRRTATGLLAAAIYLTFVEVYVVGTFTTLDSLLALFLTAAIVAFYRAVAWRDARFALLAGIAAGCAFLTKGFLGFVIPALVLMPWLVGERRLRGGWPHVLIAAVAAVATVAPWAVLIHLREGDFWNYFFWEEHIRRFLGENAQHPEPLFYFAALLPLLAFPWLCLMPAAFSGQRIRLSSSRERSAWRLTWIWAVLPFVFFSLSNGKLLTYILPCFAPLAAFLALGISSYLASGRHRLVVYGVFANSTILLLVLAGLAAIGIAGIDVGLWKPDEPRLAPIALAVGLGAVAGLYACRSRHPRRLLTGSFLVILPVMLATPFSMPSKVLAHKAPGLLLEAFAERIGENTIVVSDSRTVRAVAWYFKRSDVYLTSSGELAYGLGYPDDEHRLLDERALRQVIDGNAGKNAVVLVCKRRCPSWALDVLPRRVELHRFGQFVLWHLPAGDHVHGAGVS